MRRIENEAVEAFASGEIDSSIALVERLLMLDRKRAWWVLFRIASGSHPLCQREARIATVANAYIARRTGSLIGVDGRKLLPALIAVFTTIDHTKQVNPLAADQLVLLKRWLPPRLKLFLRA